MTEDKVVWYASYGSNCFRERFHCYIRGGRFKGNITEHEGCRDKTLPFDEKNIIINHGLYFAKKSKSWDFGGVGFIGLDKDERERTYGKMYLITQEQFSDVVKQETKATEDINIDFESTIKSGQSEVLNNSWYGNVLYLGTERDYPIFTFTNSANLTDFNRPSESYLETIVKGVIINYNLSPEEIHFYLLSRPGVINNYTEQELEEIISGCINEKISITKASSVGYH